MSHQIYLISITILEGRHYIWDNMDSAVIIRVDNHQKTTAVKKNSDCPYYNEVIEPCNIWKRRRILGEIMLDVATVWEQKGHQFYHKWAILGTSKKDAYLGPQGYLKLDISVFAKGEIPKIPMNVLNDDIEGNLLFSEGKLTDRQKAKYIFNVYNCKHLAYKPSSTITEKKVSNREASKNGPTTYIEITFAGVSVRTSTKKNTSFPEFNERLTIADMFPPLCQTIKIEACYGDTLKKTVHSQKQISLKQISNYKDEGFLPTLGPIFLHLHSNNLIEGYAGTILISIFTELVEAVVPTSKHENKVETIAPIDEVCHFLKTNKYFGEESIVLFTCLSELTSINKKFAKKPVCVRMTFGETSLQTKTLPTGEEISINTTDETKPQKIDKQHFYIDYFSKNICLWLLCDVPFFKKRVFHSNLVSKIADELKEKLNEIEKLFDHENTTELRDHIKNKLWDVKDFLEVAVKKYIDIVSSYQNNYTKLDIERRQMCFQEVTEVLAKLQRFDYLKSNKKKFRNLQNIWSRINFLVDDVQDSWPYIILWLVHGKKKVAFIKLPVRDIIFSTINEERGRYCGIKRTICFYENLQENNSLAAKMEVMMFLCLNRHKNACVANIPSLEANFQKELNKLPRYLPNQNNQEFQLRCYIFQGKIISGFDHSGLGDPFVRIIAQNQLKETQIIQHSLNPVWDETLVFDGIVAKELDVPSILFEIYDKDECGKNELIGRTVLTPLIRTDKQKQDSGKLKWIETYNNGEVSGEALAKFEYIKVTQDTRETDLIKKEKIISIPSDIKPILVPHKVEVLFWGVRDLRKLNCMQIRRPRITIFCGNQILNSDTIKNVAEDPNFINQSQSLIIDFPVLREYAPPLCLKMYDSKRFGIYVYAGVHITKISSFFTTPMTSTERKKKLSKNIQYSMKYSDSNSNSLIETNSTGFYLNEDKESLRVENIKRKPRCFISRWCKIFWGNQSDLINIISSTETYEPLSQQINEENVEDYDWWTKFYNSINSHEADEILDSKSIRKIKIYDNELEYQPEFKGFTDIISSFKFLKGKRTGDEAIDDENITGNFKGSIKIYQYPLDKNHVFDTGIRLEKGYFVNYPNNHPLRYILRVYCVRALNLRPKDLNGKSDPYLYLQLNNKKYIDKENYIPRNINPIFGRSFEFNAVFPFDNLLKISIWDYDLMTADDLIGETEIDLENRFYTKHMASCSISKTYEVSGYCAWRGQHKPTCILLELCQKWNITIPDYREKSVKIGEKEFVTENFAASGNREFDREVLALTALQRWKEMPLVGFTLVPEHVETRSLFHPSKPGIEQGKLQLWIDIFPVLDVPPPKKVNISLRKPTSYELRVIIWNTEEVQLDEDDFFSGERKSDIYVKGWVVDNQQSQFTDVHYRSVTGEGNFNWRFLFTFDYLPTENKIVLRKKESLFAADETEFKLPCKLTLQVWDNDTFSKDDFIGNLTLELAKLYRPAKSVKKCNLQILSKGAPTVNLFKIRRTKGWWPFKSYDEHSKNEICTGKVEAELELLTLEEALLDPVGVGRRDPQPLPPPNRPDLSFSWFNNPLKAIKYVICKLHKWKIIRVFCILLIIFMVTSAFYAFPGYTVKKFLGA